MTDSSTAGFLPCNRCSQRQSSLLDLRNEHICPQCYTSFVAQKTIKRLELLQRQTRGPKLASEPQRYLLALSYGLSSTALLHTLHENVRLQRLRGQRPRYEVLVVHIDTSAVLGSTRGDDEQSQAQLERYKARFPDVKFLDEVPLHTVLTLDTVDWTALPLPPFATSSPADDTPEVAARPSPVDRISQLFSSLSSTTSRADVLRLLTRHLLVSTALKEECDVLLTGYNTTSLAQLTLSETAKGRGFSLPWQINDGPCILPRCVDSASNPHGATEGQLELDPKTAKIGIPVYHPLRELFRNELLTFAGVTSPPLTELLPNLIPSSSSARGAVVSHREISIDEVMTRYFADVETTYPSVVANVVKTTGKLRRAEADNGSGCCGLCGVALDEAGDERWRGELGEQAAAATTESDGGHRDGRQRLCYGCSRSIQG